MENIKHMTCASVIDISSVKESLDIYGCYHREKIVGQMRMGIAGVHLVCERQALVGELSLMKMDMIQFFRMAMERSRGIAGSGGRFSYSHLHSVCVIIINKSNELEHLEIC